MRWGVVCVVKVVKIAGRLLEEFTSNSHLLEGQPSRGQAKHQAAPRSFLVNVDGW